jgi:hypothetical protein
MDKVTIDSKAGVYIEAKYTKDSETRLKDWMNDNLHIIHPTKRLIKLNKSEIHTTIIYSQKPFRGSIEKYDIKGLKVTIDHLEVFGNCLVAILNTEELKKLFKDYMDKYGFIYDFEEYKPHITLAYEVDVDILNYIKKNIRPVTLELDYLNIKELDPNWSDS